MPGQPLKRHMQTHRHRQAGETGIGLPKAHFNIKKGIPKCLLDWMTDRDHLRLPRIEPTPKKVTGNGWNELFSNFLPYNRIFSYLLNLQS